MSCDNAKQALVQAVQNAALPQGVTQNEWQALSDAASNINDLAVALANGDCHHDVTDMTAQLQKNAGNLAEMAADGTLSTQAQGAEIATVLNAFRMLPQYINSL